MLRHSATVWYLDVCVMFTMDVYKNCTCKPRSIGPALEFAKIKLGLEEFNPKHQTTAIRNFVESHDLLVNLPTGFGKSVIFQAATNQSS